MSRTPIASLEVVPLIQPHSINIRSYMLSVVRRRGILQRQTQLSESKKTLACTYSPLLKTPSLRLHLGLLQENVDIWDEWLTYLLANLLTVEMMPKSAPTVRNYLHHGRPVSAEGRLPLGDPPLLPLARRTP